MVQALRTLPESKRPTVVVFSNQRDYQRLLEETAYPYLEYQALKEEAHSIFKIILKRAQRFFKRNIILNSTYEGHLDAALIHYRCNYLNSVPINRRWYWIPDFQDKHLPAHFSQEELNRRESWYNWISNNALNLIVSSLAACQDFQKFYPNNNCKVHILRFCVTLPSLQDVDLQHLHITYNLPQNYFISPNQFWLHKNQMVLLKAAAFLKENGMQINVVFTGNENEKKNPDYIINLKNFVKENDLSHTVKFLGFIDRKKQLLLIKNAIAVIQPSTFEGWSTVIEDAIALDKIVVASDLPVNREQLGINGLYFNPYSAEDLSNKILQLLNTSFKPMYNYPTRLSTYAENILQMLNAN